MEAGTETPTPAEPEATEPSSNGAVEHSIAEQRSTDELFKFSEYVHVGPGAVECDDGENGRCNNPLHFHAWCRVPNPYQHEAIREKALAAKARRVRQYRQEDSDLALILDGALDEIEAQGEQFARETYVEEIVHRDFMREYFEVAQEMRNEEPEGDDEVSKWATIDEDSERLQVLTHMDPDDRPQEEYNELRNHIAEFNREVERRVREERQQPERESLKDRPLEELRRLVREQRINNDGRRAFQSAYTLWEQFIGTLKPRDPAKGLPVERVFGSIEQFKAAAPEVVQAIEDVYARLDGELGKSLNITETAGKTS